MRRADPDDFRRGGDVVRRAVLGDAGDGHAVGQRELLEHVLAAVIVHGRAAHARQGRAGGEVEFADEIAVAGQGLQVRIAAEVEGRQAVVMDREFVQKGVLADVGGGDGAVAGIDRLQHRGAAEVEGRQGVAVADEGLEGGVAVEGQRGDVVVAALDARQLAQARQVERRQLTEDGPVFGAGAVGDERLEVLELADALEGVDFMGLELDGSDRLGLCLADFLVAVGIEALHQPGFEIGVWDLDMVRLRLEAVGDLEGMDLAALERQGIGAEFVFAGEGLHRHGQSPGEHRRRKHDEPFLRLVHDADGGAVADRGAQVEHFHARIGDLDPRPSGQAFTAVGAKDDAIDIVTGQPEFQTAEQRLHEQLRAFAGAQAEAQAVRDRSADGRQLIRETDLQRLAVEIAFLRGREDGAIIIRPGQPDILAGIGAGIQLQRIAVALGGIEPHRLRHVPPGAVQGTGRELEQQLFVRLDRLQRTRGRGRLGLHGDLVLAAAGSEEKTHREHDRAMSPAIRFHNLQI